MAAKARVKVIEYQMEALHEGTGKGKKRVDVKALAALQAAHDEAVDELLRVSMDDPSELEGDDMADDFDLLGDEFQGEDGAYEEEGDDEERSGAEEEEDGPVFEDVTVPTNDDALNTSKEPSSFSKIPPAYLHKHLGLPTTAKLPPDFSDDFVELSKAPSPQVVELRQGQMLYLPASWWHEVTSTSEQATDGEEKNVHMAFNYWFYPPDELNRFDKPYVDTSVWEYLRAEAKSIAERTIQSSSDRSKRKRDSDEGPTTKKSRK